MLKLPEYCNPDDATWIREKLIELASLSSYSAANATALKYSESYKQSLLDENVAEIERESFARRNSNLRLLTYVNTLRKRYNKLSN